MFKKIIIPFVVLLGMSLMAFYSGKKESSDKNQINTAATEKHNPIVVLELFTSQGCSSCPPADVLLDKVKKQYPNEVFALSYHVDYWNYIGWNDPFSKSVYTKKQRDYNRKFQYRSNYTPQLVVNGKEHFVGSNGTKMYDRIKLHKTKKVKNEVSLLTKEATTKDIFFDFAVEGSLTGKQLRVVLVLDERITTVKRGENRNRTLKNSNIVVEERYIPLTSSKGSSSISIPGIVTPSDKLTLILLVESENLDITGATKAKVRA